MKIGIGIDTGGTCMDTVAYDFETGRLLAKGKALTTRENLSIGIKEALDMLPQEYIREALIVSLSTTLATNACLEDKGGRAKLLIFGLTDELIERFDAEANYGLRRASVRCIDTHGSADGLIIDEPDWDEVMAEHGGWLSDADALSAAELYALSNGAPCERRARQLAEENFGLSCTCAGELTSELNVLVRGTTALLNARLLPVVHEFVEAAMTDFASRGCGAPVMVVRSDGSLMSSQLTRERPVETILSGPAASVLAGKAVTDEENYIIVDMGGTTTDVSIVRGGRPVTTSGDGITLGGWHTSVKGVFVAPFALGGDSAVRLEKGKLAVSHRRATPLCVAARRWPEIKTKLIELIEKEHINQFPLHEFFYLVREPGEQKHYDKDETSLLEALKNGPCMLEELWDRAEIDIYHFDGERLEAEGIVMRAGLTPTDFMHIKGDYTEYDGEASRLAARYLLMSLECEDTPEAVLSLADEVYELVEGRLYEDLLRVILSQRFSRKFDNGLDPQTEVLIKEAWNKRHAEEDVLFRYSLGTGAALVGIGAPTHIFLPEVARALGAKCVLPEHAEVANALGALKADINVIVEIKISQRLSSEAGIYYIVHAPTGSSRFSQEADAVSAAKEAAAEAAVREARLRGASGDIKADTYLSKKKTASRWGSEVELGLKVIGEVMMSLE